MTTNPYLDKSLLKKLTTTFDDFITLNHSCNFEEKLSDTETKEDNTKPKTPESSYRTHKNGSLSQSISQSIPHYDQPNKLKKLHKLNKITLDVGGIKYSTTLTTINSSENSILSLMFSGKYSLKASEDGSYFIDRDGVLFRHILNYLRTKKLIIPKGNTQLINELYEEAEYYQIKSLKNILTLKKIKSNILNQSQIQQLKIWIDHVNKLYPLKENTNDVKHDDDCDDDGLCWELRYRYNIHDDNRNQVSFLTQLRCASQGLSPTLFICCANNSVFGVYTPVPLFEHLEKNKYEHERKQTFVFRLGEQTKTNSSYKGDYLLKPKKYHFNKIKFMEGLGTIPTIYDINHPRIKYQDFDCVQEYLRGDKTIICFAYCGDDNSYGVLSIEESKYNKHPAALKPLAARLDPIDSKELFGKSWNCLWGLELFHIK